MANNNRSAKNQNEHQMVSESGSIKITVKYEGDEFTRSFIEQMRIKFDEEIRDDIDILRKAKAL